MGRPAKPAQAKILSGNFRGDRDNHGPEVELKSPDCPVWMPKSAKKYWKDIAPKLVSAGLIGVVDSAAFIAHCDSVGKFEEVTRKLKTLEDMTDDTPQGFIVQSAMFTIRNKLWDQVMKSSNEFGLTPAARSKVKAPEQQELPMGDWNNL